MFLSKVIQHTKNQEGLKMNEKKKTIIQGYLQDDSYF